MVACCCFGVGWRCCVLFGIKYWSLIVVCRLLLLFDVCWLLVGVVVCYCGLLSFRLPPGCFFLLLFVVCVRCLQSVPCCLLSLVCGCVLCIVVCWLLPFVVSCLCCVMLFLVCSLVVVVCGCCGLALCVVCCLWFVGVVVWCGCCSVFVACCC